MLRSLAVGALTTGLIHETYEADRRNYRCARGGGDDGLGVGAVWLGNRRPTRLGRAEGDRGENRDNGNRDRRGRRSSETKNSATIHRLATLGLADLPGQYRPRGHGSEPRLAELRTDQQPFDHRHVLRRRNTAVDSDDSRATATPTRTDGDRDWNSVTLIAIRHSA